MKALAVKQPWASLIADGTKSMEVRSWRTNYRGPLVIVASSRAEARSRTPERWLEERDTAPCGVALCVVDVVDCIEGKALHAARTGGIDPTGHFCWVFANPRPVRPVKARGQLGLWNWTRRLFARDGGAVVAEVRP